MDLQANKTRKDLTEIFLETHLLAGQRRPVSFNKPGTYNFLMIYCCHPPVTLNTSSVITP